MKNKFIPIFLIVSLSHLLTFSQNVGIGTTTPHISSKIEINSTNSGALLPRMSTAQRNAIVNPAVGLLVYDLDKFTFYMYNGYTWAPLIFGSYATLPGLTLYASDGRASDMFGYAVSISGDYAIVGSLGDTVGVNPGQGSAYIFYKSSNGWIEQAKLTASDGSAGDGFGLSVGINGDYVVIGAWSDDIGANADQGSAYIFYKGAGWTTGQAHQAKLTASDGAALDYFGGSVSINGDYVIIGASRDNVGANADQGSAYIFYRGGGWTTGQAYQAKLTSASGAADDRFGISVGITVDHVIIGAGQDDIGANGEQGSAHIFGRIGTNWIFLAQLIASDGAASDNFGASVGIDGDYAIIGAPYDDVDDNFNQGSAYIYYKGGGWTTGQAYQAKLTALDGDASDEFSFNVSIHGDYVIIGTLHDSGVYQDQGSSYLFKRNGTNWNFVRKIDDATPQTYGFFGISVGVGGYNLVIGALKNGQRGEVTFLNFE